MYKKGFLCEILVVGGLILVHAAGPVSAATLEVGQGAAFTTIQSAIDAATPGVDHVFVRCGLYRENIVLKSGVSVIGSGTACTTIDGGEAGSVVVAIGTISSTVIEGLTLRNGSAAQGGGIFIEAAALIVRNNVIESNHAVGVNFPDGTGGGIHIQTDFNRVFTEPLIEGNVIRNNTADRFGGGISIDTDDGSTIRNNLIVGNTAGLNGGGLDIFSSFPNLVNNTIVHNCSQANGSACTGGGGGISLTNSGVVDFYNNLIAWNEAGSGGGGVDAESSSITFLNNDSFGNVPVNYFGIADPTGAGGNFSADPLLVDQEATFSGHLPRSDSPLVDTGTVSMTSTLDLKGVPRAIDGDADGNGIPDIGSRENEGVTRLQFMSSSIVTWDFSGVPSANYNLYRGEIAVLRASGVYTQDIASAPDSKLWCGQSTPNVSDTEVPPSGDAWFYLAVISETVEGTLGFDSSLTERPFAASNRCP